MQELAGVWQAAQARVQLIAAANQALDGLLHAVVQQTLDLGVATEDSEVAEDS
jgi:hypothetical protein